jgi:hypothetical protein
MRKQNFQFVVPAAEHKQTGADSTSGRFMVFRHYFAPATLVTGSV